MDSLIFCGAIFVAAVVSGLAGFAFALLAAVVLLQIRAPADATFVILCCSLLSQLISFHRLRLWPPPKEAAPIVLAGMLTTPFGTLLLRAIPAETIRVGVGLFLVAYALAVVRLPRDYAVPFGGRLADAIVGGVGGVVGGIAGLSGALPVAWSLVRGWPAPTQRAINQTVILVLQAWALAVYAGVLGVTAQNGNDLMLALAPLVAGVQLGLFLYGRIDPERMRSIVIAILIACGLAASLKEIQRWLQSIW
jgi:uncharacterized membrane protein YfcA